jgi:hypothetical protein
MRANSRKVREYEILRAYGSEHLLSRIDERIRTGRGFDRLTKAEREYCLMVLAASEHANEMTADERREYYQALAAYRH